jgi:hypothetical protein
MPQHPVFDHERLDVYQASLDFVAYVAHLVAELKGEHRNAKDQIIRASQSIPLNIAEGNGKRSPAERKRFFRNCSGIRHGERGYAGRSGSSWSLRNGASGSGKDDPFAGGFHVVEDD